MKKKSNWTKNQLNHKPTTLKKIRKKKTKTTKTTKIINRLIKMIEIITPGSGSSLIQ